MRRPPKHVRVVEALAEQREAGIEEDRNDDQRDSGQRLFAHPPIVSSAASTDDGALDGVSAREPADERPQRRPDLRRKRHIGGHAHEDAERQPDQGTERDRGRDAHRLISPRSPRRRLCIAHHGRPRLRARTKPGDHPEIGCHDPALGAHLDRGGPGGDAVAAGDRALGVRDEREAEAAPRGELGDLLRAFSVTDTRGRRVPSRPGMPARRAARGAARCSAQNRTSRS